MVNFKLIGFVGDYIDDKSNMSLYLPVIELDSDLYVPMREKWGNVEDLKRVDDNGKQFVNMFDEGPEESFLKPGDLIFLAGANFIDSCSRLPKFQGILKTNLNGLWCSYGENYKYRVGTRGEFRSLSIEIFRTAQKGWLCSWFVSTDPLGNDDLQDYYRVLCGVSDVDFDEWCTIRAIHYHELCDRENYKLIRSMAISRGAFSSPGEFDSHIKQEITWLKQERLRSTVGVTSGRPDGRVSSMTLESTSVYKTSYLNALDRRFLEFSLSEALLCNNSETIC